MNIRSKISTLAVLGLLSFGAVSCSDFLQPEPRNSLDRTQVFTDLEGAQAVLTGTYGNLLSANNLGLRVPLFSDLLADNLAHVGTFPTFSQIKNRSILVDNTEVTSMWSSLYSTVNRANNLIAYAPGITAPEATKNQIVAEAQFIRALAYFYLTNYWGDVPLVLTPTTTPDNTLNVARTPQSAVYDQIVADLTAAAPNLPTSTNPARATRWAALALQSRVALYRQQWADAARLADQVIAGPFQLNASYRTAVTAENPSESIFEVQFDAQTQSSFAFFLLPTANGGRNEISPTGPGSTLPTAYEAGDLRKDATISNGTFTLNGRTVPTGTSIKYVDPGTGTDNFKAIRLAEMLLNSAEAKARQNDLPGALTALNRVRTRAGLPVAVATLTQAQLLEQIERDRRVELALEGHRWFDLIRTGRAQQVLSLTDARRLLLPIPFRETVNNPNITQNPGY
ncbi:RagB/SusD family nutrient uptake outer membrane protein [Hymenobacter latericus]|uniref:RagB/SusD family nutrient uptake outer membrane protein n=1 Tax=Hymenobacter sp. YIM 151858-1 TaxID=2987688 RepID=UPI002225E818|nr:RagB/SusD family nutrient uptake outer membrane protein [Hymenobacter sp. YIM 151858-1]UYZ59224.1 RagB/SusD family nutrient uptake outer membrane protein [Hymenobacter sp. YIM 151858-1]